MIIGTVRGNIVSTINHPYYTGKKLLIVEKEDFAGKASGYLIAIDGGVGVGVGERVLVIDEGKFRAADRQGRQGAVAFHYCSDS